MKVSTDKIKIEQLLNKATEDVVVKENLKKRLESGKVLRIKLGIDPTGSVLHLGHAVVLRKLKEFQDLGHQVIFLIGDFTARIGDPTGRSKERKPMSEKEIKQNMKDYIEQASLILDPKKIEVRYNSEWLEKMDLQEIISLASKATYAQIAQRSDFKQRIKDDTDLTLHEFMYPLMVAYDSVALKADVELGGTDQKFNLLMGRQIQKRYKQEEQDVMTCRILEGLDGKEKMSKSLDNYIALTEESSEMYGKLMTYPDSMIIVGLELLTNISTEVIKSIAKSLEDGENPMQYKKMMAFEIVKTIKGKEEAQKAQKHFENTVQKKGIPSEIESKKLKIKNINIIDLLSECDLVASKGEARRLIEQGGIKVDGEVVKSIDKKVEITKEGILVQRGKRQFIRVTN